MISKLPEITALDPRILSALQSPRPFKELPLIQVPEESGLSRAYLCPSLTTLDGRLLTFGLEQERTPLGRGLVRGLWFGKEGKVWLPAAVPSAQQAYLQLTVLPYRCLIAGPEFSRMLKAARSLNPAADYGAVWELAVINTKLWTDSASVPEGIPAGSPEGEPEYHLDHPSLRA